MSPFKRDYAHSQEKADREHSFLVRRQAPSKFSKLITKYGHDDEMMRAAGVECATEQIIDLLKNNVQGIHLYIMNNAQLAKDIIKNISHLLEGINRE